MARVFVLGLLLAVLLPSTGWSEIDPCAAQRKDLDAKIAELNAALAEMEQWAGEHARITKLNSATQAQGFGLFRQGVGNLVRGIGQACGGSKKADRTLSEGFNQAGFGAALGQGTLTGGGVGAGLAQQAAAKYQAARDKASRAASTADGAYRRLLVCCRANKGAGGGISIPSPSPRPPSIVAPEHRHDHRAPPPRRR